MLIFLLSSARTAVCRLRVMILIRRRLLACLLLGCPQKSVFYAILSCLLARARCRRFAGLYNIPLWNACASHFHHSLLRRAAHTVPRSSLTPLVWTACWCTLNTRSVGIPVLLVIPTGLRLLYGRVRCTRRRCTLVIARFAKDYRFKIPTIARLGLVALSSISDICFESQMVPDSNVIRGDDDSVVSFFSSRVKFATRKRRRNCTLQSKIIQ